MHVSFTWNRAAEENTAVEKLEVVHRYIRKGMEPEDSRFYFDRDTFVDEIIITMESSGGVLKSEGLRNLYELRTQESPIYV